MRPLYLLLFLLGVTACSDPNLSFDQFEGNWIRSNDAGNRVTTERWWNEHGTMIGQGITTVEGDTVFFEQLSIELKDGQYYYIVKGVNAEPTLFRLTEFSDDYFQFSNPDNPFPSTIRYQFAQDSMFAWVIGQGNSIEYRFGLE